MFLKLTIKVVAFFVGHPVCEVRPWKQMNQKKMTKYWHFAYKMNVKLITTFPQIDYRLLVVAR